VFKIEKYTSKHVERVGKGTAAGIEKKKERKQFTIIYLGTGSPLSIMHSSFLLCSVQSMSRYKLRFFWNE